MTHSRVWVRTCYPPGAWYPVIREDGHTVFGTREEAEWYARTHAGEGREFVVLPRGMLPVGVPEWEAEYGGES